MKRFCFLVFLFFCFLEIACVHHEVSPIEEEKIPPEKTFKEKIQEQLNSMGDYPLIDSWIPISTIWQDTNIKSYNYTNFFKKACPSNCQKISDNEIACDFSSTTAARKFKIKKGGGKVFVKFEKFGYETEYNSHWLRAEWEITGASDNFTVIKYENANNIYKIIEINYKSKPKPTLSADGSIGGSFGIYYFYFNNFYYDKCPDKPVGEVFIESGENKAKVFFYNDSVCDPYVYIEINGYPGKYGHTTNDKKWILRDLFDYLAPFLN